MAQRQARIGPLPAGKERQEFLETQPTYWLKRCYQALRRCVEQELREYGLTLSQRDVLLALWEREAIDQTELRERLGLEQSSVSRLVDGLVRRQLVELREGETDRRVRIWQALDDRVSRHFHRCADRQTVDDVRIFSGRLIRAR
jgi:DNA-binding transcriptional regulator GbsR (MarR family)